MGRFGAIERSRGKNFQGCEGRQAGKAKDAVRKEAVETGASIARDAFMSGSARLVVVDVQREDQTCLKVSISLSMEE